MDVTTNLGKISEESSKGSSKNLSQEGLRILNEQGIEAFEKFMEEQTAILQQMQDRDIPDEQPHEAAPRPSQEAVRRAANTAGGSDINAIRDITETGNILSDDISRVISKAPVDPSRAPAVRPASLRDTVKILQPKSVVFAKYSLTEWQEDILTLIMEQLQGYMSKSVTLLKPDILGEISIRIDCSSIAGDDKKKALAQIEKLMDYKFEFWWQQGIQMANIRDKKIETKGHIITTYHNYVGTPYVDLVINKWSLPFLLYYGPGIGANRYLKSTALTLPGKYAKRLYKMLIGYVDKGRFDYRIDAMRRDFQIPESYTTATINRSIIKPAVENINEYSKNLHVTAEFIVTETRKPTSKKPSYDTIHFTIEDKSGEKVQPVNENAMLGAVYTYLSPLVPKETAPKLGAYCKAMQNHGDLPLVYSKIKYYDQQLRSGKITPLKLKNTLFKIIKESAGIDLKPVNHRKIQTEK